MPVVSSVTGTEETTGIDLVKEQIKIAAGEHLTLRDRIDPRGHAIECRIYAEDPTKGFLPSVGRIQFLRPPDGPGIRHDCGVYEGFQVPIHYDPMLAKLITRGANRTEATIRMQSALIEYRIEGPTTNIPFLRWILAHPDFIENRVDTRWLEEVQEGYEPIGIGQGRREDVAAVAAAIHIHRTTSEASRTGADGRGEADGLSPWVRVGRARRFGLRGRA
jgi:acetyl-CoA carboxylase biotin carboxylase subunit